MSELLPHKKFERQIERIHQLLEPDGTEITWDDHIPDPDRPDQPRQIDIAIRRDGSLTIVECRLHKESQDVTWIEELMGRRTSLGASAVIAVSASGFTATAREKAKRYGIILRDFATLSREEIKNWGRIRKLIVSYCEFASVAITITIDGRAAVPKLTDAEGKPISPLLWRSLFENIMHQLDKDKWLGVPVMIDTVIHSSLLVNGRAPAAIELKAKVRRVREDVSLASVVIYADPINSMTHAEVGKFDLGATEIIENCDELAMVIDLSQIKIPERCCFETVIVDAGRVVTMRPSIIGIENAMNYKIPIDIRVKFSASSKVV